VITTQGETDEWDHYADQWEIIAPDEKRLGTRKLLHPHVNEHPLTRSLSGVNMPNNIKRLSVSAHGSVHAYGGKEMTLDLPLK